MKIDDRLTNVETFGVVEKRAFTINGNAHVFKILRDQIYSKKIEALMREISCNAWDSHVDAGKPDLPFDVHLPTMLEPWLSIRDYGVGISDDDMKNMYNEYFNSTKTRSNSVTGCFGLGSKSPFAYSDAFTVTSWFDGVKISYSAYIDKDGAGVIAEMEGARVPTDECNGFEVFVAVKEDDFHSFENDAKKVLRRFNPLPNITGHENFDFEPIEYVIEGEGWALRKTAPRSPYSSSRNTEGAMAIQGNVAYPIDTSSIIGITSDEMKILSLPIDIWFGIGDIGVTPSRESLSYDDGSRGSIDTIGNLKRLAQEIFDVMPSLFADKFDECATLWDAKLLYKKIVDELDYEMQNVIESDNFKLEWNGHKLNTYMVINNLKEDYTSISVTMFERNKHGQAGRATIFNPDYYNNALRFEVKENTHFFFDDLGRGAHKRIKTLIDESSRNDIRLVYLIKSDSGSEFTAFKKALGGVVIKNVDTLPKPVRAVRVAGQAGPVCNIWVWDGTGTSKENWNPTKTKLKDGGIYVMLGRFRTKTDKNIEFNMRDVHSQMVRAEIIDESTLIYGIPPRNVKAIKDNPKFNVKWTNILDYAKDEVIKKIKRENLADAIADAKAASEFKRDLEGHFDRNEIIFLESNTWTGVDSGSSFMRLITAVNYMNDRETIETSAVISLATRLGYEIPDGKVSHNLTAMNETMFSTYPMLAFLKSGGYGYGSRWEDADIAAMKSYITLIDNG